MLKRGARIIEPGSRPFGPCDGRNGIRLDSARRFVHSDKLPPELRREAGQPFFQIPLISVGVANRPTFVHNQPLIPRSPMFPILLPLFSLLFRPPPPIRLIAAGLVDGVEVPKQQRIAARLMTPELFP
jgi:hypothetical protein